MNWHQFLLSLTPFGFSAERRLEDGMFRYRVTSRHWLGTREFDSIEQMRAAIDAALDETRQKLIHQSEAMALSVEFDDEEEAEVIVGKINDCDKWLAFFENDIATFDNLDEALETNGLEDFEREFLEMLSGVDLDDLPEGCGLAYAPRRAASFRFIDGDRQLSDDWYETPFDAVTALSDRYRRSETPTPFR